VAGRFRFRLEALLRVRRSLEEEAKRALARTIAARDQALARAAALREAHGSAVEGRRSAPGEPVDLDRLRAIERYLLVLEKRIAQADLEVAGAEARVAEARQALLKAHQEHLILLRLKERRQEQHALDTLREEAKEMDEIAVLRYHFALSRASNT
jgi:flagellar FliJ protein